MPFPKTKNVGKLVKFIKKEHPDWSHDQVVAAALSQARKSGAKIPKNRLRGKNDITDKYIVHDSSKRRGGKTARQENKSS